MVAITHFYSVHLHIFIDCVGGVLQLTSAAEKCGVNKGLLALIHSAQYLQIQTDKMSARAPYVVPALKKHTATVIMAHGLGDSYARTSHQSVQSVSN